MGVVAPAVVTSVTELESLVANTGGVTVKGPMPWYSTWGGIPVGSVFPNNVTANGSPGNWSAGSDWKAAMCVGLEAAIACNSTLNNNSSAGPGLIWLATAPTL